MTNTSNPQKLPEAILKAQTPTGPPAKNAKEVDSSKWPFYWDLETSGLDWNKCWISCIGWSGPTGSRQFGGLDEKRTLESFHTYLKEDVVPHLEKGSLHVTYNGARFDIPFLVGRAKAHNLDALAKLLETPAFISAHLDLIDIARAHVSDIGSRGATKREISYQLDIYEPKTTSGADCALKAHALKDGRGTMSHFLEILTHNAVDLATTRQLHDRFQWEGWC